ncbi:MAG: pentapeptide repeat-containing protein [Anaerolineae bacterium]|nr:pentapeptide repeat-containing protein [Anaerolineae bacterium]
MSNACRKSFVIRHGCRSEGDGAVRIENNFTTLTATVQSASCLPTCAAVDLRGRSFAGADLRDSNLADALLNRADLREADLTGANFQGIFINETHMPDNWRSIVASY